MKPIEFTGSTGHSTVLIGGSFMRLGELCDAKKTVTIADKKMLDLHGGKLTRVRLIPIDAIEQNKTLTTVNMIHEQFLKWELDRSWTVVGVGGGIICDIAGFAASIYLRGLPVGFVPTTLLAMADASVGGKNGVNYQGYKNLIGTFRQPGFVLCDFTFLKTLPYGELKNGLAEVVKAALICDINLFEYLERNKGGIIEANDRVVEKIVEDAVNIKLTIVSRDEMEEGERRKLNFGHTIGHAIEKTTGCSHGEAVSIGMVASAKLSAFKGLLKDSEVKRIETLLDYFKLPVKLRGNRDAIMDSIRKDKKREGETIHFVLLSGLGDSLVREIELEEIRKVLLDLCQCS